ncbi:MAG: nucleotide disphospho-sugar-binding domain-containing protein [Acidobacteriota bacterium]
MATIGFLMHSEMGHLNSSLGLAKKLKMRGHQIYYFGLIDFEEIVRNQGFHFIPIFENYYPRSTIAGLSQSQSLVNLIERAKKDYRIFKKILEAFSNGSDPITQLHPDLLIVDSLIKRTLLPLANKLRIPLVVLSTTLPWDRAPGIPPLRTTLMPASNYGITGRLNIALHWKLNSLFNLFRNILNFPYRRIASQYETSLTHKYGSPPQAPKLILCPQCFDFPRSVPAQYHYVEAGIDTNRVDVDFPWDKLDGRPILYCSLGSVSHLYKSRSLFYQAIIDTIRTTKKWQLVMTIGKGLSATDLSAPDDVVIVEYAPQLQLLARTDLMITHGGLNSIKECILFGVPMIVFPNFAEQPGNAARVVYHGLGIIGNQHNISAKYIKSLIDTIDRDPSYRRNIKAMSDVFKKLEEAQQSVEIIESLLVTSSTQPSLAI